MDCPVCAEAERSVRATQSHYSTFLRRSHQSIGCPTRSYGFAYHQREDEEDQADHASPPVADDRLRRVPRHLARVVTVDVGCLKSPVPLFDPPEASRTPPGGRATFPVPTPPEKTPRARRVTRRGEAQRSTPLSGVDRLSMALGCMARERGRKSALEALRIISCT